MPSMTMQASVDAGTSAPHGRFGAWVTLYLSAPRPIGSVEISSPEMNEHHLCQRTKRLAEFNKCNIIDLK
jgi:hypothetical protein